MSAWGDGPATPTPGTVITTAFWNANGRDLLNILRALTGGDPSANRLLVGVDANTASWQVFSAALVPDGTITDAKLQTPKVSRAGDAMTGHLAFASVEIGVALAAGGFLTDQVTPQRTLLNANNGRFDIYTEGGGAQIMSIDNAAAAPTFKGTSLSLVGHTHAYLPLSGGTLTNAVSFSTNETGVNFSGQGRLLDQASPTRTLLFANGSYLSIFRGDGAGEIMAITPSSVSWMGNGLIHAGNIGSQSVASAATAAAIADGAVSTASKIVNGIITGAKIANNQILSAHVVDGSLIASDMNSAYVDGFAASPSMRTLGAGSQQAAAGDHSHGASGTVPSGLIAAFATAAAIASGWTRYTAADGRLLIGAGTTSGTSQSFTENANAGAAAWPHTHVATGLTASSSFTGTTATIPASASTDQANVTTPATPFSLGAHTHAYTPAGSVGTTIGGSVGDTIWIPPSRAVVWAQKT